MVEYDKKRQGNREAITALQKVAPPSKRPQANTGASVSLPAVASSSSKRTPIERDSWLLIGNCFIQMPTTQIIDMLSTEQAHIEQELKETNASLKKNVEQLLLMEGLQDEFSGFDLQALK